MTINFDFLQAYWLLTLPIPWIWLQWRKYHLYSWPQFRPLLMMRYPLLADLSLEAPHKANKTLLQRLSCELTMALTFSCLIIALAQPVSYQTAEQNKVTVKYHDYILVIDTALSMSLSDYQINSTPLSRMKMAHLILTQLLNKTANNRVALVILGNPPALWLPYTRDKNVLIDAINRTSTLLGGRISDMGATLNFIGLQFSDATEKNIILVSDGGTQTGSISPQKAARQLSDDGFTLHILAMGASGSEAHSFSENSLIYEPVNLARLKLVVEQGKGRLFYAEDTSVKDLYNPVKDLYNPVKDLYKPVKDLSITLINTNINSHKESHKPVNHYYPFALFLAMILMFFSLLIQTCPEPKTYNIEADND